MSLKDYEIDELDSDYGDDEVHDETDPNVFQIRDPLPPPSASVFTTQQLHRLIHEGYVDLCPPYQRGAVWNREKQMTLIESIFRNFYIPPVLFFVKPACDDSEPPLRVCMDGKQRLSSIQAFFDGQIPYKDPETKKQFYYMVPASHARKRLLIPDKYRQIFAAKQITCVEFRDIDPSIERDIFQRVQMGVPLTAAEKLAAISSPYADWVTELDLRHIRGIDDGLNTLLDWNTNRGQNFLCIAQLVYCVESLPQRCVPTSGKVTPWLRRDDVPRESLKRQIESILRKYWIMASTDNLNQAFTTIQQKLAPAEFVFIGVLIAVLCDCEDEQVAEEALRLRNKIRKEFEKSVRMRDDVVGRLWDLIDEAAKRHHVNFRSVPAANTNRGKKRKRGQDTDDDEYKHPPTPIKVLNATPKTRTKARS